MTKHKTDIASCGVLTMAVEERSPAFRSVLLVCVTQALVEDLVEDDSCEHFLFFPQLGKPLPVVSGSLKSHSSL